MKNLYPNISSKGLPSTTFNMGSEHKSGAGFTLIEVLVAIGIFTIVVTIAVGGFVQALKTHRQTLAIMAANSNVSSALEQMTREIRTGQNFSNSSASDITFENANGEIVTYNLVGESITRRKTDITPPQKITDNNVIVSYLNFNPLNLTDINNTYPLRVIINIGISPKAYGVDKNIINLQTTVSSRNF